MGEKEMEMAELIQELAEKKAALLNGNAERVAKQHAAGKCTARERIGKLLDAGSFMELDALKEAGHVVAGAGSIEGKAVYCFAQDYAANGGAMTRAQAEKILKLLGMARTAGAPVIALLDSDGVSLKDGAAALPLYAEILSAMARLSGVCPMIACVMGPCRGLATLMTQACDFTVQVKKTGKIALHTALVMNGEKGREKSEEQLFGAEEMARQGVCALTAENEEEALSMICALVGLLPACNMEDAELVESDQLNRELVCQDASDAAALMADMADDHRLISLYGEYGAAVKTALCRIGGRSVGLICTDTKQDEGRLTAADCRKAARFVRLCDCYHLPIVSLADTAGLSVPAPAEQGALLRAAADMCYAYAEATAPKIAVATGNVIGAAYVAMGGRRVADALYAWPGAIISPLTKEAAVQTLSAQQLAAGESREALEEAYAKECGALAAAREGLADDVIEPRETRKYVIAALELLASKHDVNLPKKHGNLPL